MIPVEHRLNTSVVPLIVGLFVSIICTLAAYFIVTHHYFRPYLYIGIVAGLGLFQMVAQLIFFLHLGSEAKPRWNLTMFFLMLFVILVVIGGSLVIMNELSYYVMPQ